ncbi:MAG TPA: hypothetical protein VFC84_15885 [Desulfosporosinus sp.]|nr:hypothetical protein [Desulfosporosinus sp.]
MAKKPDWKSGKVSKPRGSDPPRVSEKVPHLLHGASATKGKRTVEGMTKELSA